MSEMINIFKPRWRAWRANSNICGFNRQKLAFHGKFDLRGGFRFRHNRFQLLGNFGQGDVFARFVAEGLTFARRRFRMAPQHFKIQIGNVASQCAGLAQAMTDFGKHIGRPGGEPPDQRVEKIKRDGAEAGTFFQQFAGTTQ